MFDPVLSIMLDFTIFYTLLECSCNLIKSQGGFRMILWRQHGLA